MRIVIKVALVLKPIDKNFYKDNEYFGIAKLFFGFFFEQINCSNQTIHQQEI
jgi:hypothetical protein